MLDPHRLAAPSAWVARWAAELPSGASVLDVACGSGRHVRWLAARGFRVTGIDRDATALAGLSGIAETIVADIEGGPWPLPADAAFDAVTADADGRASDVPPGRDPDEDQIGVVASPSSSWSLTSGHSSSLSSSPALARPGLDAPGPVSRAAMAPATHALAASRGVVRNFR